MRGIFQTLGFLLFLLFGIGFVSSFWTLGVDGWGLAHWPHLSATVVDNRGSGSRFKPVYRFELGGRFHVITSKHSTRSQLPSGTPIEIAVSPNDPNVVAELPDDPWSAPIVEALFAALGWWIYRRADRASPASNQAPTPTASAPVANPGSVQTVRLFGSEMRLSGPVLSAGIVFALAGLIMLAAGAFVCWNRQSQWQTWPHVEAKVLDSRTVDTGDGGLMSRTRYRFSYGGRSVRAALNFRSAEPGDIVELAVNPADSTDVTDGTVIDLATVVLGGLGTVFLFFGLLMFVASEKARRLAAALA